MRLLLQTQQQQELEGMISSHVDDFILVGILQFIEEITKKIRAKFDISKFEDDIFRFIVIDVHKYGGKYHNKYGRVC